MADPLFIRIDFERLTTNLAKAESRTFTMNEVRASLAEWGFIEQPDGAWLCEEISLGALDNSEWFMDVLRLAPNG
jgi:hypothetical protein